MFRVSLRSGDRPLAKLAAQKYTPTLLSNLEERASDIQCAL
jgi:hypothetical protein